ncbi:uncharacterized protein [Haliotis asinina]|uniref:uncharacterized protein n=1 Tax=Haliotis asinina TaxID=109174 RepID=UPI0035319BCB
MAVRLLDGDECVNSRQELSAGGSVKIHEMSVIGKPNSTQNGGLYPKHTHGDDSDASSSGSDVNTDVDSGISTGSDSSSDSKESSDSAAPLLDSDHTQKPSTDEAVNSCRMDPNEKRPLIPTGDLSVYTKDTGDTCISVVVTQECLPLTPTKVSIKSWPNNGAEDLSKHTREDDVPCEKPSLKKDSTWKKIAIIFSTLDILLFITILVLSCGVPARRPAPGAGGDNCLECKDVYLTEDDRRDNIYNFDVKEEGNLCCSENQTRLIQKYVVKRYRQDLAEGSAERYKEMPKRTAVHVGLDIQDKNSISEGVNQVLKWSREDALMNGNLTLTPNGTHIQCGRPGLYYIHSKVVFKDTISSTAKHGVLLLQVYRVRDGQDLLLLENRSSQCGDADRDCNVPSSVQGVFHLQDGDQVFVSVTKSCGLVLEVRYNYLEMYLV